MRLVLGHVRCPSTGRARLNQPTRAARGRRGWSERVGARPESVNRGAPHSPRCGRYDGLLPRRLTLPQRSRPTPNTAPELGQARFPRAAVIGDVHGRLDLLERLLAELPEGIPLVVLGDLCDRGGPDTAGVIGLLIARGAVGVRGNHEEWLRAWLGGEPFDPSICSIMGGLPTLRSYGIHSHDPAEIDRARGRVPEAHQRWLLSLPVALDLEVAGERYWVVHAGVSCTPYLGSMPREQVVPYLAERYPEELLWPKQDPARMAPLDRTVIMGHVPQPEVRDLGHVIAVDTGSGRPDGRLSAVILPERRAVTVG